MRRARLDAAELARLRLRNGLQTLALLGGMFAIAAVLAQLLLGPDWAPWMGTLLLVGLFGVPRMSAAWLMRMSGARPLALDEAPELYALVGALARRAGLERPPDLYLVPRRPANAFAVGRRADAAIAVTSGLLRTLDARELEAVLAHEIAHVLHDDMRVMLLAEIVARITGTFAQLGLILLFMNMPLVVSGRVAVSWSAIWLLVASPTLSVLLQLAVSRSRERQADLEAARLTGDPRALASALRKIGESEAGLFDRLWRHRHGAESVLLRTHPATGERIRNLLALEPTHDAPEPLLRQSELERVASRLPPAGRRRQALS